MTTVCVVSMFPCGIQWLLCCIRTLGVFPLLALWVQGVLCGVCAFCWWRWLMLGVVSAFTVGVGFRVLGKWLASRLCLTFCVWCFVVLYRQWLLFAWCLPVLLWRWLSFIRSDFLRFVSWLAGWVMTILVRCLSLLVFGCLVLCVYNDRCCRGVLL